MSSIGIRDLKNRLSHYVRQVEAGRRVAVTAHGRVVAELVPPGGVGGTTRRFDALVADGTIRPGTGRQNRLPPWPRPVLPPGSIAELIDSDRG